jgi:hypothetical protein
MFASHETQGYARVNAALKYENRHYALTIAQEYEQSTESYDGVPQCCDECVTLQEADMQRFAACKRLVGGWAYRMPNNGGFVSLDAV